MKHLLTAAFISAALWFAFYLSGMGVLTKQTRATGEGNTLRQLSCTYFVGFETISQNYWLDVRLTCPRIMWVN